MVKLPFGVEFHSEARNALRRLNKPTAQRIMDKIKWLSENLDQISHEALSGEFKGLFKLRIGDYRAIYSVDRGNRLLAVHLIGHRRSIYERR